jgi:hypothetical protein
MLSASYGSIFQTGFGVSAGIAMTSLITLLTVDLSDRVLAAFVGAMIASSIAAIILLGLSVVEYRRVSSNIKRIKERRAN